VAAASFNIANWPAEGLSLRAALEHLAGVDYLLFADACATFDRDYGRLYLTARGLAFDKARKLYVEERQEFGLLEAMWQRCVSHLDTAWRQGLITVTGRCGDAYAERIEIPRTRGVEFGWHDEGGAVCDLGTVMIFDLRVLPVAHTAAQPIESAAPKQLRPQATNKGGKPETWDWLGLIDPQKHCRGRLRPKVIFKSGVETTSSAPTGNRAEAVLN
jgi:hypothetical protein